MCRRKYHPHDRVEFVRRVREEGHDHVVLGGAVVVESDVPMLDHYEWPSEDDHFFLNVLYSIDYPDLG